MRRILQYALDRSSLHNQSLPGGYVANWSHILESAGSLTFGGARSSMPLMRVAFRRHLHLALDLGRKNATLCDLLNGAEHSAPLRGGWRCRAARRPGSAHPTSVDGPDLTGQMRVGRRRLKSARKKSSRSTDGRGGGGGRNRAAVAAAAGEVAALRGVRAGRRGMVQQAIVHMFLAMLNVRGGEQAATLFLEVLQSLATDGLEVEDDVLYDDPTRLDPGRAGSSIPESVAAAGLGAAERVHLAASLRRRSVLAQHAGPRPPGAGIGPAVFRPVPRAPTAAAWFPARRSTPACVPRYQPAAWAARLSRTTTLVVFQVEESVFSRPNRCGTRSQAIGAGIEHPIPNTEIHGESGPEK